MNISHVGDNSTHNGQIINNNQDGTVSMAGSNVCVNGCLHSCPIEGHGTTPVSAITVKTKVNGKLVVTSGAVAGCGAIINSPNRNVSVE